MAYTTLHRASMETKQCIIFLDIDGVLNTKASWKKPFSLVDECIKNFCIFVNRDDDDTEYKGFDKSGVYIINAETGFSEKDIKRIKWKKTLH